MRHTSDPFILIIDEAVTIQGLSLALAVKNILCTFLTVVHFFTVPGPMPLSISPAGRPERLEFCTACKSHADEKPVAAHSPQRVAKAGKIFVTSPALTMHLGMHRDFTDSFIVHMSGSDLFSLIGFSSVLSDRAPPLFESMESFILS
jgi:hypothetical protein